MGTPSPVSAMRALRHALRSLRRSPAFALTTILTLALGIAAMGAMASIVHGILLAPLPYDESERLVTVRLQTPDAGWIGQPPALHGVYERHARSLDGIAFHRTGSTNVWIDGRDDGADSVVGTWISASMMTVLRASPLLGRAFTAEEELRGGPQAVILSEAEWRTRFGAAPDVIGKILTVNSVRRQVVGVMPARFAFPTPETRLWLPVKRPDDGSVAEFLYAGVARLAPQADAEQASRELAVLLPRLAHEHPRLQAGGATVEWLAELQPRPLVIGLREHMTAPLAAALWLLAAAAALVLLVAWGNASNLLLLRADAREPERAVRAAIGAGPLRAAAPLWTEASVLGAVAGLLALPLVFAAVRTLVAFGPDDIPRLAELEMGPVGVGIVLVLTLASMGIAALVPALRARGRAASLDLRESGRAASAGARRMRVRAVIATLQIAVALAVTAGSALLLRTAHELARVDPGFDGDRVLTLRTQLPFSRYDEAEGIAFYGRFVERVRALPGVDAAGLVSKMPLGSGFAAEQVFRIGMGDEGRPVPVTTVDDGYFAAMSIPLIAGRVYRGIGSESGTIVISRRAAEVLLDDPDGTSSVGKSLALASSGLSYTVIGVIGDVRHESLATPPAPMIYRSLGPAIDARVEPAAPRNLALVVRSVAPADTLVPAIRRLVHELDPAVPIYEVESLSAVVDASTANLRLLIGLMTACAVMTLLLAVVGLHGLMAYLVALRTREFGVRIALGAAPARIARWVAMRGLTLAAAGLAIGLGLYAVIAPLLRRWLYGVTPDDPWTLVASTLLLVAAAALASAVPAWRAARVEPARALRAD